MNIPGDYDELTALFRKLGALHPERWAVSQAKESIPQLARFLFLREAWKLVVPDEGFAWMDSAMAHAQANPTKPYAGVGLALKRIVESGASREDINALVRGEQATVLFGVLCLMDDPNLREAEVRNVAWGLFQCDADGNPTERISGLHESLLETDPTGREMRPKGARSE